MGLTANVVANTPIATAWGNETRDRAVQVFASIAERTSQWTSPPEGAHSYLRDVDQDHVYNGTAWVCVTPVSATVAASETFTATVSTYAALATGGPSLSLLTGTRALVTLTSAANSTVAPVVNLGVLISGATSLAASDANGVGPVNIDALHNITLGRTFVLTGLTPGLNTFTMVYKSSTNAGGSPTNFLRRDLTVVGLP